MIRRRAMTLLPLVATLVAVFGSTTPAHALADHTFRIQCAYSHAAPDDPIVFANQPGASHLHTFFGNTTTDAFSTHRSLRAGTTTCNQTADASGYWVPALYQNGNLIAPGNVAAYYRAAGKAPSSIRPFPAGLEMVAGDAHATAPQAPWVTTWSCLGAYLPYGGGPPYCIGTLSMIILFPDCWDGRRLDSADHKSHMAYAEPPDAGSGRTCPKTHPIAVPQIRLEAQYPSPTLGWLGGPGTTLASGPWYTAHGDFFNAWDQSALETQIRCHIVGLGLSCAGEGRSSARAVGERSGGLDGHLQARLPRSIGGVVCKL